MAHPADPQGREVADDRAPPGHGEDDKHEAGEEDGEDSPDEGELEAPPGGGAVVGPVGLLGRRDRTDRHALVGEDLGGPLDRLRGPVGEPELGPGPAGVDVGVDPGQGGKGDHDAPVRGRRERLDRLADPDVGLPAGDVDDLEVLPLLEPLAGDDRGEWPGDVGDVGRRVGAVRGSDVEGEGVALRRDVDVVLGRPRALVGDGQCVAVDLETADGHRAADLAPAAAGGLDAQPGEAAAVGAVEVLLDRRPAARARSEGRDVDRTFVPGPRGHVDGEHRRVGVPVGVEVPRDVGGGDLAGDADGLLLGQGERVEVETGDGRGVGDPAQGLRVDGDRLRGVAVAGGDPRDRGGVDALVRERLTGRDELRRAGGVDGERGGGAGLELGAGEAVVVGDDNGVRAEDRDRRRHRRHDEDPPGGRPAGDAVARERGDDPAPAHRSAGPGGGEAGHEPRGEDPDGDGQQGRRGERGRPAEGPARQPGRAEGGEHDDDGVDDDGASRALGGHGAQQVVDRLPQHRARGEVHGEHRHQQRTEEPRQDRERQVEGDPRRQHRPPDADRETERREEAERQPEEDRDRQLREQQPAGTPPGVPAQPGEGDLVPTLVDGRPGDEEEHEDGEQGELHHDEGDDHRRLVLAGTDPAHQVLGGIVDREVGLVLGQPRGRVRGPGHRLEAGGVPVEGQEDHRGRVGQRVDEGLLGGDEVVDAGPGVEVRADEPGLAVGLVTEPVVGLVRRLRVDAHDGQLHGRRIRLVGREPPLRDRERRPGRPAPGLLVRRGHEDLAGAGGAAPVDLEVLADVRAGAQCHGGGHRALLRHDRGPGAHRRDRLLGDRRQVRGDVLGDVLGQDVLVALRALPLDRGRRRLLPGGRDLLPQQPLVDAPGEDGGEDRARDDERRHQGKGDHLSAAVT